MFLKAVDIAHRRVQNTVSDPRFLNARHATDDPHFERAVELLAARGPLTEADLAELGARVRRHRALAAWRGLSA